MLKLTPEIITDALEKNNYSLRKTSSYLKINFRTLKKYIEKFGLAKEFDLKKELVYGSTSNSKTNGVLRYDINLLKNEVNKLKKILNYVTNTEFKPPNWLASPVTPSGKMIPVLFTSDFQWGEVVKENEINGINKFNKEIAKERYELLIEKAILLGGEKPEGLVLLRGGDSISGDIHEELLRTNDMTSIESVTNLAEIEVAGINRLKKHFKRILVISVPGNHGRTTVKPMSKGYVSHNYDTLVTHLIQANLKGSKDVSFFTPDSGDAYFSIFNQRFLLTHGDRIGSRGGQGFIGPAATVLKGAHKVRQQFSQVGKPVDWLLLGHFHTPMLMPHVIVNGSLVGFSEYAQTLRVEPSPAQQTLFHVHSDYGLVNYQPIYLNVEETKPRFNYEEEIIKLWK